MLNHIEIFQLEQDEKNKQIRNIIQTLYFKLY